MGGFIGSRTDTASLIKNVPLAPVTATDVQSAINELALLDAGTDATLVISDITTNNSTTLKHGFLAKLSGTITQFLSGQGTWENLPAPPQADFIVGRSVSTYADLPPASSSPTLLAIVLVSTGIPYLTLKAKGLWYSDGVSWLYQGDYTLTNDASQIINTPSGGIVAVEVQGAIDALDLRLQTAQETANTGAADAIAAQATANTALANAATAEADAQTAITAAAAAQTTANSRATVASVTTAQNTANTAVTNAAAAQATANTGVTNAAAAQATANTAGATLTINSQTGTTYQFVLGDAQYLGSAQKLVSLNNALPITVTLPSNATVNFPVGARIDCIQDGVGKVTISPAAGVTINSKGNNKSIGGQYVGVSLIQEIANTWYLIGDLIA